MSIMNMCIVNPMIVEVIGPFVGSQDITIRLGISWNSWIKIAGGMPVRLSVGQRLKSRIMSDPYFLDILRSEPGCLEKLKEKFLSPMTISAGCKPNNGEIPRSLRRARELLKHRESSLAL